jgi:phospholipid transport system substrate-binding protein
MEISAKRRSMAGQFKKEKPALLCAVAVLLIWGHGADANEKHPKPASEQTAAGSDCSVKDANDPNELWWRKWDAVIKDPNDANEVLGAKLNAVVTVLQNKELNEKLKEKIIDKIMSPIFDFDLMSKLVLGKRHWGELTAAQQKRFTKLFTKRLKSSYLEKISLYKDEKPLLKPAVKKKNDNVYIAMDLLSDDTKITAIYKLRRVDNRWKIYDVEIQDVSIVLTYRSQFDSILRRGSVKDLFSQLEKPPTQ